MSESRSLAYPPRSFIDPNALMRIRSLELRARAVVEGYLSGIHRSPYHGFSAEFTEYRPYVPGDDTRHVDWRLFARSDRYYVKQFEDETNLRCHLLLDVSRSMTYGSLGYNKVDYARTLAATFSLFLNRQRDAVGLIRFEDRIVDLIPARYRPGQFRRLLVALEPDPSGTTTDLCAPLSEAAMLLQKRGLIVLLSDMLAPVDLLAKRLGELKACGHEVVLFQILDPAEATLAIDEPALLVDLESGREMYVDPETIRRNYVAQLEEHQRRIRSSCDDLGIYWQLLQTDQPLELALGKFLRIRSECRTAVHHRA